MFPWVYEFHWSPYHIIFLGIFFTVVLVIASTVGMAVWRSYRSFKLRKAEAIQWEAEFEDLPEVARVCRHELTGEVKHRTCHNGLDCRTCATHPDFLAAYNPEAQPTPFDNTVQGFAMPLDRRYHRGHTWVKKEDDGTCTIGLDDFAARLIGEPDAVELPKVGAELSVNGTGWFMKKQDAKLRILSPVNGHVIQQGTPDKGWFLKVRADDSEEGTRHLLRGAEVRPWIMREMERLQYTLPGDGVGMSLADGGELMPEMWKQNPKADWDGVWGEMFLES
jgi:glycine cleavage system H lipoate-binding protein